LFKDYQDVPGIVNTDDVVKRPLSLVMASRKEKLKVKLERLMNKVRADPEDTRSPEAQTVALTIKILDCDEHMQTHRRDTACKHYPLMSIGWRKGWWYGSSGRTPA
jgi:ribosomal protein S15P/S13E